MKDKRCYVFGAGEYYGKFPTPQAGEYVIAADGGLTQLKERGIPADLVVGDFDSLKTPPEGENLMTLPQEKDDTDMMIALQVGLARGHRRFHIYGGTGGRFDHTMANIQCLAYLCGKGARGFLFDNGTVITAIKDESIRFSAGAAGYISVFALTDEAKGVYEEGLRYSLTNATLQSAYPIGVSNEFTSAAGKIAARKGILLVIFPQEAMAFLEEAGEA